MCITRIARVYLCGGNTLQMVRAAMSEPENLIIAAPSTAQPIDKPIRPKSNQSMNPLILVTGSDRGFAYQRHPCRVPDPSGIVQRT